MSQRLNYFHKLYKELFSILDGDGYDIGHFLDDLQDPSNEDIQTVYEKLSRTFPEAKVLGGGCIGIVVHSTHYPDVVAKYCYYLLDGNYFGENTGLLIDSNIPYCNYTSEDNVTKSDTVGYDLIKNLPPTIRSSLSETYEKNEASNLIISKYEPNVIPAINKLNGDLMDLSSFEFDSNLVKKLLLQYIELLKRGIFITDFSLENFTYNKHSETLKILDLDCLRHSKQLAEVFSNKSYSYNIEDLLDELFQFCIFKPLHKEFYDFILKSLGLNLYLRRPKPVLVSTNFRKRD